MSWLEGCQKQDEIKWLDGGHDKSGAGKKKEILIQVCTWLLRGGYDGRRVKS